MIKSKNSLLPKCYSKYPFYTSRDYTLSQIKPQTQHRTFANPKQYVNLPKNFDLIKRSLGEKDYYRTRIQKTVRGLDTETINGKIKLLAIDNGNHTFVNDFFDVTEFIFTNKLFNYINFFYNLKYDAQAILSLLDKGTLMDLHFFNKVEYDGIKITYIPKKLLTLKVHNKNIKFYDIFPFYLTSLNKASKVYFGEQKLDFPIDKINDEKFWISNRQEIIDYCVQDAYLCKRLGDMSQEQYNKLGLDFNNPISTASMAEQFAIKYSSIPKYYSNVLNMYGWFSYWGGRFEQFSKGYFEQTYKYDLNSAYPFHMSKLPDLAHGGWSDDPRDIEQCEFGFVFGIMKSLYNYIQPIAVSASDSLKYPQTPKHYRFLTVSEYKYFIENDLMVFEIISVSLFFPDSNARPFYYLENMYSMRLEYKRNDDPRQLPLKILMNATYGKCIQCILKSISDMKFSTGNMFNPMYASYITAETRLDLLKFCAKHDIKPISMYTDSVTVTDKLSLSSKGLGEWDLEIAGELLAIGCGVYSTRDGDYTKTNLRGFRSSNDTSLFELLENNRDKSQVSIDLYRPLGLGEIVRHIHKRSLNWVNEWIEEPREVKMNFDNKRTWKYNNLLARDLLTNNYDSEALILSK